MNEPSAGASMDATPGADQEVRPEDHLGQTFAALAIVCAVAWISNTVNGAPLLDALPGVIVLYLMVVAGLVVGHVVPFYLPSVAWVSLVSIVFTLPYTPGSGWIVSQLEQIDFLAVVTPILAYAGLSISQREFSMFRQVGWKLVIVALLVFTGTFLGSALIAHALL